MTYVVGGLIAFCGGLVFLLYWVSKNHEEEAKKRQQLFDEYELRKKAIINDCDIKIDSLKMKELKTNEEVLGYLNDSRNIPS